MSLKISLQIYSNCIQLLHHRKNNIKNIGVGSLRNEYEEIMFIARSINKKEIKVYLTMSVPECLDYPP